MAIIVTTPFVRELLYALQWMFYGLVAGLVTNEVCKEIYRDMGWVHRRKSFVLNLCIVVLVYMLIAHESFYFTFMYVCTQEHILSSARALYG